MVLGKRLRDSRSMEGSEIHVLLHSARVPMRMDMSEAELYLNQYTWSPYFYTVKYACHFTQSVNVELLMLLLVNILL